MAQRRDDKRGMAANGGTVFLSCALSVLGLLLIVHLFSPSVVYYTPTELRHHETYAHVTAAAAASRRRLQDFSSFQSNTISKRRPIMFSFYEPIGDIKATGMTKETDQQLLQAWKDEWSRQGWDPQVVDLDYAKKHPEYERFNALLDKLQITLYDRYCFLRYLAMSVVGGGWMSDYDTFPLHPFDPAMPNQGRLTIHEHSKNGGVPALVSGSSQEYHRVAMALMESAEIRTHETPAWSDMFALHDMYVHSSGSVYTMESNVVPAQVMLKHTPEHRICRRTTNKHAIHFSHYAMEVSDQGKAKDRTELARKWLKDWRIQCLDAPSKQGESHQMVSLEPSSTLRTKENDNNQANEKNLGNNQLPRLHYIKL